MTDIGPLAGQPEPAAPSHDIMGTGSRGAVVRRNPGGNAVVQGYDGVGSDEGASYLHIWRTILKWRWIVLGIFATVLGLSILMTLLTTPIYRAAATMEIAAEEIQIIDTADSKTASVSMAKSDYMETQ